MDITSLTLLLGGIGGLIVVLADTVIRIRRAWHPRVIGIEPEAVPSPGDVPV